MSGKEGDANIRDREHHRLQPASEQAAVAALGEKDAIDAGFDENEHRKNANPKQWRRRVLGIARNPVLRFEPLKIRQAAALFPQLIGKRRPAGDERLLPLEANLLQIAVEARRGASFLLRLDFTGEGVQARFGLVESLLQIFLETGRSLGEVRERALAGNLGLRGILIFGATQRGQSLMLGSRRTERNDVRGDSVPLLLRALIDIARSVDNALAIFAGITGNRGITHNIAQCINVQWEKDL